MNDLIKYKLSGLHLEVTRKCNLRCVHCLCGEPQDIDISKDVIDRLLLQVDEITMLLLTGGEPLLALDCIEYLFDAIKRQKVKVSSIGFVTNGTVLDRRVIQALSDFLQERPECRIIWEISYDKFHDKAQSEKCLKFYQPLVDELGERCSLTFHEDIDWLHYAGRAWGKLSVLGIPVKGVCDCHFGSHQIKIVDNRVSCLLRLSANGGVGFAADESFEEHDKRALGNILNESLSSMFERNNRTCVRLCDECFCESAYYNFENFQYPSLDPVTYEIELYLLTARFRYHSLRWIWKLREWAVENCPDIDIHRVIAGTVFDCHYFFGCIEWLMIYKYRNSNSLNRKEKLLLISDDSAMEIISGKACMKYEKHYSKKFPDSTKEEIYRLSFLKTYNEFVAAMTLDDLMLALFRGAPAKEYFNRIEKYIKDDHMDNDVFNPCALIPDTIDPRADKP